MHTMSTPLAKLGLLEYAVDVRTNDEGVEEAVFPATEYERVIRRFETLRANGYSDEVRGDVRSFRRGWSYCLANAVKNDVFIVRILDMALCPDSRTTDDGLAWAGISLTRPAGGLLVAGPAWQHVRTWSRAHYFWGPIGFADAVSAIGSELRGQSPRVVGPWTLPDQVWFDVRALGVDAKVRLMPSSLAQACYLFQRATPACREEDVPGVLIEVTGAEQIC
jgi:hypothetical protein